MKKYFGIALFAMFMGASLWAGTNDNLGLSSMWTVIQGWVQDGYLSKILGLMFFAVGVQRAFDGQLLQFFLMLGLSLLIVNADTIMATIFSATI
ncbi:MAG: hypothetical protein U9Q62_08600 [Campylobacterota bacterium]|nr:hypothetical protein [Campylobacterota bacterium]